MKIIRLLLAVLIIGSASSLLMAQERTGENNSGSFYSYYGLGYPVDISSVQEGAMGIFGVSLNNGQASNLQNPALWSKNIFTTAISGFSVSGYKATDSNTNSQNALLIPGFLQLTLPIKKEKLGFSASLYQVTRSSYRLFNSDLAFPTENDTLNYVIDSQGSGGVNKLEFGLGWSITPNISVGYAPSFAFISKKDRELIFFAPTDISTINVRDEINGTGVGHRFGLLLTANKLLNSRDRVTFGSSLTLPLTIDGRKRTVTDRLVEGAEQEVQVGATKKGDIKLPLEINSGLTYYPSSLVNFSLEGQVQKWSEFKYELDPVQERVMSDRYRLGLGGQYHPYKIGSDKILTKFKYSAGLSYDTGHLTLDNKNIETLWLSAGLGILSTRRSQSTIDISFRYGLRGTKANNLVKENIWNINLSLNLAELMFFQRKLQ